MKICMAGLGSIGKRHLHNLAAVLKKRGTAYQIDALRHGRTPLSPEGSEIISGQYGCAEELPDDYDVVFVTNPTYLHYETIRKTAAKTKHMFIEKPVFDTVSYNLKELPLNPQGVYYVACPIRHKSVIKYIKHSILDREKVLSARIISTSFLPEWRKGIDYRNTYSARRELGGGVTRDLIHEWDYALYLFGTPINMVHMQGKVSDLEIDSDDVSIYMARYYDMFLEMHLDYIGRKTERILQLFTDRGRIDTDLVSNTICRYQNDKLVDKKEFSKEDCYINEMEYFLDCIEGRVENINTLDNACRTLEIALADEWEGGK